MFSKKKIRFTSEQWLGLTILISIYRDSLFKLDINCPRYNSVSFEEILDLLKHIDLEHMTTLLYQYTDSIYEYMKFNPIKRNTKAVLFIDKSNTCFNMQINLIKENRTISFLDFIKAVLHFLYDYKKEFTVLNSYKKMVLQALN